MYVCLSVCLSVCLYVCMYACMYLCKHAWCTKARPMEPNERKIFIENDWKLITAAQPNSFDMPPLSQCSPWLCMNVLSLSEKVIFCEESEKGMIELFNDQGFDCITLPFRNVFEFGGSFHCVTTDIRRRGQMKSYFKALDAADAAAAEP